MWRWLMLTLVVPFFPGASASAQARLFDVDIHRDVTYYRDGKLDNARHRLDLYLPKGHKDYPVVFMVHGGAWVKGDKNQFGMYGLMGRNFARNGIGLVSINYRLSPEVRHPEHVRDVARAFAWVHKNIGKHGGRSGEIFVSGHSAGGHLAALLCTDESFLKEQGLSFRDVRAAIPVSGVFALPKDPVLDLVFGKDAGVRQKASPIHQACANAPPFLILYAESELPHCDGPCAEAFCKILVDKKCPATALEVKRRNHLSIMMSATSDTDPVFQTYLSFINTHVALERLCTRAPAGIEYLQQCIARYALEPEKK